MRAIHGGKSRAGQVFSEYGCANSHCHLRLRFSQRSSWVDIVIAFSAEVSRESSGMSTLCQSIERLTYPGLIHKCH
jgi:hypothetical protein